MFSCSAHRPIGISPHAGLKADLLVRFIGPSVNAKPSWGFQWRNVGEGEDVSSAVNAYWIKCSGAGDSLTRSGEAERSQMSSKQGPPEKMMFQLNLRRRGISDQAVLRALEEVPREDFVGENDRADAYRDSALGIACGQTISQPFVVAYMTEQLQLQKHHRVLEIGTGSGYQAAVLSRLARTVLTVERFRTLADSARRRLEQAGCGNVEVMLADGYDLPANIGPFDRIIVTAAMAQIPENLTARLETNGILIAPVGPPHGVQTLVRIVKAEGGLERKELVDVRFVPALPGIAREL
jgi:protein-L-isoaspartate(D-aspartate) O-methyltransferase